MDTPDNIEVVRRRNALNAWCHDQKRRMALRFPLIEFEANHWPIMKLYNSDQRDFYFDEPFADFDGKDISYRDAIRCLVAEMMIAGRPRVFEPYIAAYRLLSRKAENSLFELTLKTLRQIEADVLIDARQHAASAKRYKSLLTSLEVHLLPQLAARGVISRLNFIVSADVKAELQQATLSHARQRSAKQGEELDRKLEAFNEAFNALIANPLDHDGRPLLSAMDREALCAVVILMCAPSRINEPLCMSIDDYITIDDYAVAKIGSYDAQHDIHKLLLMKGSKGAQWSAKPVLQFMIDALDYCFEIIREQGKRSRMLVEWYQQNPTTLYLPPELEHLRGRAINRKQLAQICYLTPNPPIKAGVTITCKFFNNHKDRIFKVLKPDTRSVRRRRDREPEVEFIAWADIEKSLVTHVHAAMETCRMVTGRSRYRGDLSKMLFLFDYHAHGLPFLPQAVTYRTIKRRLKQTKSEGRDKSRPLPSTLFQKLNITMPVNGKIEFAEIDTHDPRRWLTTQALIHGENLSNVLINKWANRLSLASLKHYDKRFPEFKAAQAAMPETLELTELADLSNGLTAVEKLEGQFGLSTAIVTAHDAGIAMSSMNAVTTAIENRPVAKSSRGIIIIYPQRFGVCFHQHHEKPCRNYSNGLSASCVTCNEAASVKGHIPTNDETRTIADQLFGSILRHLENLAITHNRAIADDPAALGEHMLTLVEKGLDRVMMVQLATHLIDNFHQFDQLIKDRLLANRLHQAFVAREVVKRLDDPSVTSGALIKYHNPTQHAEPLLEIALNAHGGREKVERDEKALIALYPQFAPKALGLTDQRHLITPDDDNGEN
ncbi:hypothetical protein [Thauera sp.]|uniref:hypothetical protein n=1 Tax=Thauera sp. TaxID=1905334 RepID=UPI001B436C94|nr:hypothetical protein [Thauera sp.]MBP6132705.1 hypothetical protein [Thauera sp.]